MLNKVIIMGRLTADPELRQTTNGIATVRFSVAVDRSYRSKDTGERQADFIRCTAWRASAEFISRYFKKGSMIIVEGSLRNNDYTDNNGVKHYSMDVQVDNVSFGETKTASQANGSGNFGQPAYSQPAQSYQQPVYQQPAYQQQTPQAPNPYEAKPAADAIQLGGLDDFEEILSDGEVPF